MNNSGIKNIIEKYQRGDSLADEELDALVDHFKNLYDLTQVLPQEFALFRREIQRMFFMFEGFQQRRLLK